MVAPWSFESARSGRLRAMGKPGPKPGSPRKKQRKGLKQGKSFSKDRKELQASAYEQCKELLASNSGSLLFKGKKITRADRLYELLHPGQAASSAKGSAHQRREGALAEPKRKGPAEKAHESVIKEGEWEGDLVGWVVDKIEKAKKGSFVTLNSLKHDLQVEHGEVVSKRYLRKTLKRLGFRYLKRKGKWISRRNEERVLRRLWEFCKWCIEPDPIQGPRSQRVAGGAKKPFRYQWVRAVGFQDETSILDGEFRKPSWCAPHPGSRRVDNFYDVGKGKGTRINVLHTIFTLVENQPESAPGVPLCLIHWKSTWTGKQHRFKGEYVTGDHIEKYFCDYPCVFHELQGGAVCIDNASTHKVYSDAMHGMDANGLEHHIEQKIAQAKKGSYRAGFVKQQWQQIKGKYVDEIKESKLRKFIRDYHLMDTVLKEKGALYGCEVVYLAQYYPESNPIERYWALLKRRYYDTDPSLPHAERMRLALSRIPKDFVQKCIEKSLQWVWEKYEELKALPKFGGPGHAVGDPVLAGLGFSESSDSDSD